MFARAGATKWDSTRIFLKKYITGPNTCIGSAGIEGVVIWHISPKPHLNFINLAQTFTGNSVHIRHWYCIGLIYSGNQLKISISGVWARLSPLKLGNIRCILIQPILRLFFNFAYVLTIIEDILGPFGALHLWK